MTPGYDVNDDALPLPRSGKGNDPKAIPTGSTDEEVLARILPRPDTTAIEAAMISIGHDSDEGGLEAHRPRLGRSLSKSSMATEALKSHSETDAVIIEDSTGDEASHPRRNSVELKDRSRPLSRAGLISPDHAQVKPDTDNVAIPARGSSRPDRTSSNGNGRIAARSGYNIPQRVPRADEVELAKRILAQATEGEPYSPSYHREYSSPPRTNRSATPPPIGRSRRRIIYESDEEEEEDYYQPTYHDEIRNKDRNRSIVSTPVTAIHIPTEEKSRSPASLHRHSHSGRLVQSSRRSSQPPPLLRPSISLVAYKSESRTPAFDQHHLYEDAEPPPISQRRPDHPRSRRGTHHKYTEMGEERHQDYSVKNGLRAKLTPDYRPRTVERIAPNDDAVSISQQSTSKHSTTSNGSSRTADFFGPGIFQVVLRNPTTAHQLLKFSEARFCSESVEFLQKVEKYQTTLNTLAGIMTTIHKDHLAEDSPKQINVNSDLRKSIHSEMKSLVNRTLPSMETLFTDLQESVEHDVYLDVYPRFVRYQMALSATKALATNRYSYQGLGDCFCLTNPAIADNPIVYASDGFVKVTGFSRSEIIPRNCRFLQGAHTDRGPVRRLKTAIEEGKESVELILNYKKNGDPFWNLLYVAPLYNESGKLAFFLGGQINCSTTIHSNVDVMRVLSMSSQDDTPTKPRAPSLHRSGSLPSARKAFLKVLGVRTDSYGQNGVSNDPGMENKLLHRMEGQTLNAQMKEFYTAYSKYLILSYDSFVIKFYSEGVMDILHPANNTVGLVAGQEVFRFFKQNMVNNQSDYKGRVRNALRSGSPISLELRLQTRRSALFRGDEKFMTHWTPLKDEKSLIHWVVVTMSPAIQ
ncbi:blue light receptor [Colletotrichum truncatum]|uniref:Blue light receptor n=1 Tax=Colletotrichum truncatum TaxID=5467 RepID=A0ACC3ZC31_COLTU|nr:blue light receptor [Colletotrichum truncatum]KAF6782234.1 blue light receptor [Colletotrichum truncatum]